MKKRITVKKLNRSFNQRKALFKGLIVALVKNEEITTTKAKATAVRSIAEKLITKGKLGSLHARRQIQSFIQDKEVVKKIVDDLGKRFKANKGGYLTATPLGNRKGDNAPMVKLSLSKKSEEKDAPPTKKSKSKKSQSKPASKERTSSAPAPQTTKEGDIATIAPLRQRIRKVQNKG